MATLPRAGGNPQTIPQVGMGWGGSFSNSSYTPGFFWDASNNILYTQTFSLQFNIFLNVTQALARKFLTFPNPDVQFAEICNVYPPCLMTEGCVPLITEDGVYITV